MEIYRYNDDIAFRQCSLANNSDSTVPGDCTCFQPIEKEWKKYYSCKQYGIHLHCPTHTGIELEIVDYNQLRCPECDKIIEIENLLTVLQGCLRTLNIPKFKDATLIRLDDWYVPELKEKVKLESESDYWMKVDVKTDKDKDTMIVVYVGKKSDTKKTQLFIKPEKLQLTSDHKDLDPATLLAKIEVTLKDRTLKQEYDS